MGYGHIGEDRYRFLVRYLVLFHYIHFPIFSPFFPEYFVRRRSRSFFLPRDLLFSFFFPALPCTTITRRFRAHCYSRLCLCFLVVDVKINKAFHFLHESHLQGVQNTVFWSIRPLILRMQQQRRSKSESMLWGDYHCVQTSMFHAAWGMSFIPLLGVLLMWIHLIGYSYCFLIV